MLAIKKALIFLLVEMSLPKFLAPIFIVLMFASTPLVADLNYYGFLIFLFSAIFYCSCGRPELDSDYVDMPFEIGLEPSNNISTGKTTKIEEPKFKDLNLRYEY